MLYLIGLGLSNEKDLSINALETLKKCKFIYLEFYTSMVGFNINDLEKLIGNNVLIADRNLVESNEDIIENSKDNNVALLIKGDVFSATTHADLYLRANKSGIKCNVIHNSSILTAVGDTGLSLYKFGKIISIPFDNENVNSAYDTFLNNKGMHSLFLLDLNPYENRYMDFKYALNYLINKSAERNDDKITKNTKIIVCAALGTDKSLIKYGKINNLLKLNIELYPQCIIVPSELHFMEEEMLNLFKF